MGWKQVSPRPNRDIKQKISNNQTKAAYSYYIFEQDGGSKNKDATMVNRNIGTRFPQTTSVLHCLFSSNLKYPGIMKEKGE